MRRKRLMSVTAGVLATGMMLAACGTDNGDDDNGSPTGNGQAAPDHPEDWGDCDPTANAAEVPDPDGTGDDDTDLTIGIFEGWDESYASAYLFQAIMEEQGYTVNFTELEAGLTYAGLANGDIDFTTDGWLPVTHPQYIDQYGDSLENLGCWYDNASLTIAVNEDAPIQSLAELSENIDEFGGTLYGIEPGAGLTSITDEEVLPTYDPDGNIEFAISSTPAMLSQLRSATQAGENVAVTLWHPHWAYDAFPIRDLEDPEGALGETEYVYSFGRTGFHEEFPNAAQLVTNFVMTDEELAELENLMFSDEHYGGDDHEAAVAEWIDANPEWVENLKAGTL